MNHRRFCANRSAAWILVTVLLCLSGAVRADVFYTPRTVLAAFFPSSKRVTYRQLALTPEVRQRLGVRLGAALPRESYTFYVALGGATGETVDGYALIDEASGQYMPITYAVKFSPKGEVERMEIMVYLEKYGSEVRDDRFRRQFVGKTLSAPLILGSDVVVVSGASISSRALVAGVRRSLFLLDELILHPPAK